jgi:hypothetical protein
MNINYPITAKVISEGLLSLYPTIVKLNPLTPTFQMMTRFIVYALISSIFMNWSFIKKHIFHKYGISLMLINIIHIISSQLGFLNLSSGISYTLFYTYPTTYSTFKPFFCLDLSK